MSTEQELTMEAMEAVAAGRSFQATRKAIPEPRFGEVRIAVKACGVCGGDALARNGLMGVILPRVPGHEIAGTIDKLGEGVSGWKTGDRAGVGFHGGHCFACEPCREGDFTNCANSPVTGLSSDGGYAQYMCARQEALARIPDTLTFVEAAPLMCAGIATFNALRNMGARAGNTVAIQGLGGLGHLAVQFAAKMGFRTVALARGADKEELARRLGADEFIDSEAGEDAKRLLAMGGAHFALSTAPASEAQVGLLGGLKPNGRLVILAHDHKPLAVPGAALVFGRRSVAGWYSGHAKDSEDTLAFAALRGVRAMVETFPLREAEQAFQSMSRVRFRAVLTTSEQ